MLHLTDLPETVNGNGHAFGSGAAGRKLARTSPLSDVGAERSEPHNIEAEQALLGAILINNEAHSRVSAFLLPAHFFDPVHARIYEAAAKLIVSGRPATPITLRTFFETAQPIERTLTVPQYLGQLVMNATTIMNAGDYGRVIYDLHVRRQLIWLLEDAAEAARNPSVDNSAIDQLAVAHAEVALLQESYAGVDSAGALEFVSDMQLCDGAPDLIDGLLSSASISALYGPSRAGKTFLALEMGYSIALGRECLGRATQHGSVLYVLLEGRGGFAKRLHAAKQKHGDPGKAFARLKGMGTLGSAPESATFATRIIAALKNLGRQAGVPPRLVIIDTLACALAGDNENDAATMAAVLGHANRIVSETGATVLLVAHPGKDKDRGMRGSSALFAGCDDVIEIERQEGASVRNIVVRKHRDGQEGLGGSFTLQRVEVGQNALGEPISSCVIDPLNAVVPATRKSPLEGSAAGKALNELERLILEGSFQVSQGHASIPDGARIADVEEWRTGCRTKRLSENGNEDSERKAFNRARQALSQACLVAEYGSSVWLTSGHAIAHSQEAENAY